MGRRRATAAAHPFTRLVAHGGRSTRGSARIARTPLPALFVTRRPQKTLYCAARERKTSSCARSVRVCEGSSGRRHFCNFDNSPAKNGDAEHVVPVRERHRVRLGPSLLLRVLQRVRRRWPAHNGRARGHGPAGHRGHVRAGQRGDRGGHCAVPRDAHRHQHLPAQPGAGRPGLRPRRAPRRRHQTHAALDPRRDALQGPALLTVCVRKCAVVDVDPDQHRPAPVHRGSAVPLPPDPAEGRPAGAGDLEHGLRPLHPHDLLVPPAAGRRPARRTGRPHLHPRVSADERIHPFPRLHRLRRPLCLRPSHGLTCLPLPADLPQAADDAQPVDGAGEQLAGSAGGGGGVGRAGKGASRQPDQLHGHRGSEQDAAQTVRQQPHGRAQGLGLDDPARGAAPLQAPQGGARVAAQRGAGAAHVAPHHPRHGAHLHRRTTLHCGTTLRLLPQVVSLCVGADPGPPQHGGQPAVVRRLFRELPRLPVQDVGRRGRRGQRQRHLRPGQGGRGRRPQVQHGQPQLQQRRRLQQRPAQARRPRQLRLRQVALESQKPQQDQIVELKTFLSLREYIIHTFRRLL